MHSLTHLAEADIIAHYDKLWSQDKVIHCFHRCKYEEKTGEDDTYNVCLVRMPMPLLFWRMETFVQMKREEGPIAHY